MSITSPPCATPGQGRGPIPCARRWSRSRRVPAASPRPFARCAAPVDGNTAKAEAEWQRIVAGSRLARSAGLEVHAGHGLDYATAERIARLPEIVELNIGYYMIGEALFIGLGETVRTMRAAMDRGRKLAAENHPSRTPAGKR